MTRNLVETAGGTGPVAPIGTRLEILGIAGSGKSTTARLLCGLQGFRPAGFIHARRPGHLLQIVRSVPRLRPILLEGARRAPRITWREIKLLAYVERWSSVLRSNAGGAPGVLVFDQGPLYALARLTAEGKPFTRGPSFASWRDELLARWARELDVVVWLDASDDVLVTRINTREQGHQEKGVSEDAARRFLRRYRTTFDELLRLLDDERGPTIVRIDTAATPPREVAAVIVRALTRGGVAAAPPPRKEPAP